MKSRTIKLGGSLYLRIPDDIVKKNNIEEKKDYYIPENLWNKLFEV